MSDITAGQMYLSAWSHLLTSVPGAAASRALFGNRQGARHTGFRLRWEPVGECLVIGTLMYVGNIFCLCVLRTVGCFFDIGLLVVSAYRRGVFLGRHPAVWWFRRRWGCLMLFNVQCELATVLRTQRGY